MSDDLERLLRERFQRTVLPSAPFSLRTAAESIVQVPPMQTARRDRRRLVRLLAVAAVLAVGSLAVVIGGGGLQSETALQPSPVTSESPVASASPTVAASATPAASASPIASAVPATPNVVSGAALIRTSAAQIGLQVLMAPGQDGSLFVAAPAPTGTVVTLLDRSGEPQPGWPITIGGAPSCVLLLPVDDGSVRLVCSDRFVSLGKADNARAFAFGADGEALAGWPVDLGPTNQIDEAARYAGRMVGDTLTLVASTQTAYDFARVTTVAADGAVTRGVDMTFSEPVEGWGIGPDGFAYGVTVDGPASASRVTSMDTSGRRSGWPVDLDGIASGLGFSPAGPIVLTVGSPTARGDFAIALDPAGNVISRSDELPFATFWRGDVDCRSNRPDPPIVGPDGTAFIKPLDGEIEIYALNDALRVVAGWPFRPSPALAAAGYDDPLAELSCRLLVVPAVSPDGTLILPLSARNETVGGSVVAVDPDGEVRDGWPVELTRVGAEFWSVVVGQDGTVYALAIEPEAGDTTSATILAFAPDSTVRYTNTIIEP